MEQKTRKTIVPVSVIIPCFRCTSTIERAITSVLQQTQQAAEVILVDDASDDDTLSVLQNFAKQYQHIKVIALTENQGAAHARNVGWNAATQPYIAFLDADDAWHLRKLEIQTTYMLQNQHIDVCGHEHDIFTKNESFAELIKTNVTAQPIKKYSLLLANVFTPSTMMLKTNLTHRFADDRRYMEDHLLWLDIIFNDVPIVKLKVKLAAQYKKPYGISGLSTNLWAMEQGELQNYRHLYKQGFINFLEWLMLSLYSLMKFLRRLIIYWGWLRWKT